MKFFVAQILLLIVLSSPAAFAQTGGSLRIVPRKVVYTRKGKDIDFGKKTFTVIYPTIRGGASLAARGKIERAISYWRVFETPLAEHLTYTWLTDLDYKVNYNKNNILDISLTQAGVGAYPDEQTENFVFDLKTGERIKAADVFVSSKLKELAAKVRKAQLAEIKQAVQEIKKDDSNERSDQEKLTDKEIKADFFANTNFKPENLDSFRVSDKGVTFLHDYGFNHATQAFQPPGTFFYSYSELKPFIKPNGLFGQFIR